MAIAYSSAGAGVSTESSGGALSPACPATVNAGDILILQTAWEGTTSAPSPPGDWTLLYGPQNVGSASVVARHWVYGKIADGTEDGAAVALGSPAVTTQRAARIYSFTGRVSGTITQLIPAASFTNTPGDTDPTGPSVTTTIAGSLACALVYQHDNNTLETFASSSDVWTERGTAGGFIFALAPGGVLDLLTATPAADPGTVSGGAMTVTNDPWSVIGFEIRPSEVASVATLSATEANDTLSGDTDVIVSSILTTTEASDTLASDSDVLVSASVSVAEAVETLSSSVSVLVTSALSVTDQDDALSASAGVLVLGVLSVTEQSESLSADGTVAYPVIVADLSTTDASDTLGADASVFVVGSLSKTDENEALSSSGSVFIVGSLDKTELDETLSADVFHVISTEIALHGVVSGQSVSSILLDPRTATFSVAEDSDSLSSSGTVLVVSESGVSDDADESQAEALHVIDTEVALHGVVSGQAVSSIPDVQVATRTANLSVTEENESLSSESSVLVSADLSTTEQDETLSADGTASQEQQSQIIVVRRPSRPLPLATIQARLNITEEDESLIADAFIANVVNTRRRLFKAAIAG